MKMPAMPKAKSEKPHIRMRKLRPVAASAFPTGPAAFPADPNAPGPDAAMGPPSPAMPGAAGGGDMGG